VCVRSSIIDGGNETVARRLLSDNGLPPSVAAVGR
jgi:hypothetical protein